MSDRQEKDYRSTLQLPRTEFSMRANLLEAEPRHQKRWDKMSLYQRILEAEHPAGPFVFHDGPPYANGAIHMGHLLNKILKDLVVRSRLMMGHRVHYVPGWDCHGLPIEHRVMKSLGDDHGLDTMQIRRRCHDYAARYVKLQAEQLRRLGTLADYDSPYLTMNPAYEADVLKVFEGLVQTGLVYRDVKPVHWSIANETALAEAELEYYDRTDPSVYVLFDLAQGEQLPPSLGLVEGVATSLMIWTTTPWTLPANQAVAIAPQAEYGAYRFQWRGQLHQTIVARALQQSIFEEARIEKVEELGCCRGEELAEGGRRYVHPFIERRGHLVEADYVTLEDGTGLVHTAPGHGADDYFTGIREGLPIYCPVQSDGTFDDTVPEWIRGQDVWTANETIVAHLRESGHLLHAVDYLHSYPHDWRSKTPTIFRATEQWFVAVDRPFGPEKKSLRERALEATRTQIEFVPDWGQARLEGMLESRPDWCISRQRSWGLPIPAFMTEEGGVLLTSRSVAAVAEVIAQHGSDFWFEAKPAELLAGYDPAGDPDAPEWAREAGGLDDVCQGRDIFDVWFESGSSWNAVLRARRIGYPADLYLEGSDQHRGWFQLSLLPALGVTGSAPFEALLTHGFIVDSDGRKMSKTRGNALEVEEILKKHGADICRWWVSSLNYAHDVKVDLEFFKIASEEYRKVRNTVRFLLGNLADFDPSRHRYEIGDDDRYSVDAWARAELADFVARVRDAYATYQYKTVSEAIFNFCNETLSAIYMDAVKDRLYCDPPDAPRRRRTQTVLYDTVSALIRVMAPILVHTAEEAWLTFEGLDLDESDASVHLELLPETFSVELPSEWKELRDFRRRVMRRLEEARSARGIKNTLDMGVRVTLPAEEMERLRPFEPELADLMKISRFQWIERVDEEIAVDDLRDEPRCDRCWRRDVTVGARGDAGLLCDRDAEIISAV